MRRTALLLLAFSVTLPGSAGQKAEKAFPEHGTVVAVRARTNSPGVIFGPSHGLTVAVKRGSYRVETGAAFYEFEERGKHPTLALNEKIDFRIEKDIAYVRGSDGKVKKYRIIGEESKPPKTP